MTCPDLPSAIRSGTATKPQPNPGTELDRLVANAIGLQDWHGELIFPVDNGKLTRVFCPSRDLDAAFYAAEKAGLFCSEHCCIAKDDGWWYVVRMSEADMPHVPELHGAGMWWPCEPYMGKSTELPHAICLAIIALKERK